MDSYAERIKAFLKRTPPLNGILLLYLGEMGFMIKDKNFRLIIDPSNRLDAEEIDVLEKIDLVLYSVNHPRYFILETALDIFNKTGTVFLVEDGVYNELYEYIPSSNLVKAKHKRIIRVKGVPIICLEGIYSQHLFIYIIRLPSLHIFYASGSGYLDLTKLSAHIGILPSGKPSTTASPDSSYRFARDLKLKKVFVVGEDKSEMEKLSEMLRNENIGSIIPEPGKIYEVKI